MTAADRPGFVALWQQVFGDEPGFIRRCMAEFVGEEQLYITEENGDVAAILNAAPCEMAGCKGTYLYALATAPERRAAGLMSRLMAFAEAAEGEKGAAFAALIPASAPLFGYYQKRGYTLPVELRYFEENVPLPAADAPAAEMPRRVPLKELAGLRRTYLNGLDVLHFPPRGAALVLEDLEAEGAALLQAAGGYALCLPAKNSALVPELGAADDQTARRLIDAARTLAGGGPARVSLPAQSGPLAGRGTRLPAALIKPLKTGFAPKAPYLRFALDELAGGFDTARQLAAERI